MDKNELDEVVTHAQTSGKNISITFKPEAIPDLNYLQGMIRAGIIELSPADECTMFAVLQSGSWDRSSNRTMAVKLTPKFALDFMGNLNWFCGRMWRALESAKVAA